ncbi:hypothetical protein FGRMN_11138 [Fusarium graminum]|nr:hypothetical protein FGRMN_11138 [Fusarium graminum]
MTASANNSLYDRWLKDAEPWVQGEDWNPDEYFKWTARLAEAKANLDDTYLEVDRKILEEAKRISHEHYTPILKKHSGEWYFRPNDVGKLLVRPIIAYHFYQRATFEEIAEKALVKRVQMHLVQLRIPMLDIDIAQMLQYAADKVPIVKAVESYFRYYAEKLKKSDTVADAYNHWGLNSDSYILVGKLQATRVNGGSPDRSKIPQFLEEMCLDRKKEERFVWPDDQLEHIKGVFNTNEKLDLWLDRCMEPLVQHDYHDGHAPVAVQYLIDEGEFKKLLELAEREEKEHCSWEATIGPAIKALKRLGRTSAGKDMTLLAGYAKAHQKPQVV